MTRARAVGPVIRRRSPGTSVFGVGPNGRSSSVRSDRPAARVLARRTIARRHAPKGTWHSRVPTFTGLEREDSRPRRICPDAITRTRVRSFQVRPRCRNRIELTIPPCSTVTATAGSHVLRELQFAPFGFATPTGTRSATASRPRALGTRSNSHRSRPDKLSYAADRSSRRSISSGLRIKGGNISRRAGARSDGDDAPAARWGQYRARRRVVPVQFGATYRQRDDGGRARSPREKLAICAESVRPGTSRSKTRETQPPESCTIEAETDRRDRPSQKFHFHGEES